MDTLGRNLTAKEKELIHDALLWWRTRGHRYVVRRMVDDGLADEVVAAVVAAQLRAEARARAARGWSELGTGVVFSLIPAVFVLVNGLAQSWRVIPVGRGLIACAIGPVLIIVGIIELVSLAGVRRTLRMLPQVIVEARNAVPAARG